MPIFEYRCRACGDRFEVLVRSGSTPSCPKCRAGDLEKLLSSFAFRSARGGMDGEVSAGGSKCAGCAGGSCSTCH